MNAMDRWIGGRRDEKMEELMNKWKDLLIGERIDEYLDGRINE